MKLQENIMDFENYSLPQETKKVRSLINNFHYFMIFANMKNKDHVEKFFDFALEFENEIRNSDGMRSIEFLDKVNEIEKILKKLEDENLYGEYKIKYPTMKNSFSSYCSIFKIDHEEPYNDDLHFEEAMFNLKFGIGEIPESL